MSYTTEFPDFDYIPLLHSFEGWQDVSWHNDICPSFERTTPDNFIIKVFFDYKDNKKREVEDDDKYYVALYDNDDAFLKSLFITDEDHELRQFLISIDMELGGNL